MPASQCPVDNTMPKTRRQELIERQQEQQVGACVGSDGECRHVLKKARHDVKKELVQLGTPRKGGGATHCTTACKRAGAAPAVATPSTAAPAGREGATSLARASSSSCEATSASTVESPTLQHPAPPLRAPTPRSDSAQHRNPQGGVLRKATVNLLGTYKSINQLFFERKKQAAAALQECAGDKWCKISRGDVLRDDGKYRVIDALGKGTFGQVVRASVRAPAAPASSPAVPSSPPSTTPSGTVAVKIVPTITSPEEADGFKLSHHHGDGGGTVAVKIVQGKASFYRQAQTEISILRQLNAADVHGHHVIRLQDAFMHGPHVCMVFPVLADSLYDLLLKTAFRGVSLHLVRKFGAQLLRSLQFIGSQGIVHTDLKPENVLLVHARRSGVRVIDFGSSCRESQSSTSSPAPCVYIQSRFYRSPEIMLGLPWGRPIDMWSLGCMLFELHEGRPLFNGNDEAEQLALLNSSLGCTPSQEQIASMPADKRDRFFKLDGNAASGGSYKLRCPHPQRARPSLEGRLLKCMHSRHATGEASGHEGKDFAQFTELIRGMLDLDPRARFTPQQALDHPFFTEFDRERLLSCRRSL